MARSPQVWSNGPWKRVRDTLNAFNNAPDELVSATNIYLQDTVNGSGALGRLGYNLTNASSALAGRGQGVFSSYVRTGDATHPNFVVAGGHLYRVDEDSGYTVTDVTPSNITIDSTTEHVYIVLFNGHVIVSDGFSAPWVASNLLATPITATPIDIDGSGSFWSVRGKPAVYGGSLVFLLKAYTPGTISFFDTDIVWSAPGDPATGYIQNPYDFRWTLQQTDSRRINGLCGTNLALFYFRDYSIGALTGTPATAGSQDGSNFRNNSTQDAISANVGCAESDTIVEYGQNIFFADVMGRPWMMPLGGQPVPIWQQMQSVIEASNKIKPGGDPQNQAPLYTASIDGQHGLYLLASMPANVIDGNPPQQLAVFDARTGAYEGVWFTGDGNFIEAQGVLMNGGVEIHTIIGSKASSTPVAGGYLWVQNSLNDVWGDGVNAVSAVLPSISITTPRFGLDANLIQNVDRVTAVTGSPAQVKLTVTTPQDSAVVSPTPSASTDGIFRAVAGAQVMGRGVTVKIEPQGSDLDNQWSVQRIEAQGVSSLAGPDDV